MRKRFSCHPYLDFFFRGKTALRRSTATLSLVIFRLVSQVRLLASALIVASKQWGISTTSYLNYGQGMLQITSFPSLVLHLEEANGSYAKSSLEAYFFSHAFTGSSFESFYDENSNEFTEKDIVAVSLLSVNIPRAATRWILGEGRKQLSDLLKKIDTNIAIEDQNANLTKDHTAWNLWKAIHSRRGIGETMASKLLAAKRPALFPIYDQHVAKALQLSQDRYWQPWQDFMRDEDGKKAKRIVTELAQELGKQDLSTLRLLDIVIWMQQHGHKFITQKLVQEGSMVPVNYAAPLEF